MSSFVRSAFEGLRATLFAVTAIFVIGVGASVPASAQEFQTSAKQALLMDDATGAILYAKNIDEPMVPASMAKVMTVAVMVDELRRGRISEDTEFTISEDAWRRGGAPSRGSTMFAEIGSRIALPDLLRGIIVHSGNDASIAAAEGIAGSEEAFARMMTNYGRSIGLRSTEFRNATGFHHPEQLTTARELALLTRHLIEEAPEIWAIFGEEDFLWNGIRQRNRFPLIGLNIGAEGGKTGFVSESGHGLVGSVVQNDQRLIVVVNGLPSEAARATEARRLVEWGLRAFERRRLFEPGEAIGRAQVFGGESAHVPLVSARPVEVLNPRGTNERLTARIVYEGPLLPPVEAGTPVGVLRVTRGDVVVLEAPLEAGESVPQGPLTRRAFDGAWELVSGGVRRAIWGE